MKKKQFFGIIIAIMMVITGFISLIVEQFYVMHHNPIIIALSMTLIIGPTLIVPSLIIYDRTDDLKDLQKILVNKNLAEYVEVVKIDNTVSTAVRQFRLK